MRRKAGKPATCKRTDRWDRNEKVKGWKVEGWGSGLGFRAFFFFWNLKHLIGAWFKRTKNSRFFGIFKPFIICPIKKNLLEKKILLVKKKFYWLKKKLEEKFYRFFFSKKFSCAYVQCTLRVLAMYILQTANLLVRCIECTLKVHWRDTLILHSILFESGCKHKWKLH